MWMRASRHSPSLLSFSLPPSSTHPSCYSLFPHSSYYTPPSVLYLPSFLFLSLGNRNHWWAHGSSCLDFPWTAPDQGEVFMLAASAGSRAEGLTDELERSALLEPSLQPHPFPAGSCQLSLNAWPGRVSITAASALAPGKATMLRESHLPSVLWSLSMLLSFPCPSSKALSERWPCHA